MYSNKDDCMSKQFILFNVGISEELAEYSVLHIGYHSKYIDDKKSHSILKEYVEKSLTPFLTIVRKTLRTQNDLKLGIRTNGYFLSRLEKSNSKIFAELKDLISKDNVFIVDNDYYDSYSFLYSEEEFCHLCTLQKKYITDKFGKEALIILPVHGLVNQTLLNQMARLKYFGVILSKVIKTDNETIKISKDKVTIIDILDDLSHKVGIVKNLIANELLFLYYDLESLQESQLRHIFKELELNINNNNICLTDSEFLKEYSIVLNKKSLSEVRLNDQFNKMQLEALKSINELLEQKNSDKFLNNIRQLEDSYYINSMMSSWPYGVPWTSYYKFKDNPYGSFIGFMNILNDLRIAISKRKILVPVALLYESKQNLSIVKDHLDSKRYYLVVLESIMILESAITKIIRYSFSKDKYPDEIIDYLLKRTNKLENNYKELLKLATGKSLVEHHHFNKWELKKKIKLRNQITHENVRNVDEKIAQECYYMIKDILEVLEKDFII